MCWHSPSTDQHRCHHVRQMNDVVCASMTWWQVKTNKLLNFNIQKNWIFWSWIFILWKRRWPVVLTVPCGYRSAIHILQDIFIPFDDWLSVILWVFSCWKFDSIYVLGAYFSLYKLTVWCNECIYVFCSFCLATENITQLRYLYLMPRCYTVTLNILIVTIQKLCTTKVNVFKF